MKYFFLAFKRAFDFNGKSSKKEFWYFFFIDLVILFLIGLFTGNLSSEKLADGISFGYLLITIVPFYALGFRRLNDAGYNKYLFFIPIANLFFASMESKEE